MKTLLSSLFLALLSLTACAQAPGDLVFSKRGANGRLEPVNLTPQAGKVIGFDGSLNLVMTTGGGGGAGLDNIASAIAGGTLTLSGTLSAGRILTIRDAAGTLALTSDLAAYLTTAAAGSTYSPLGHGHAIADTTGLQTALDAKLASAAAASTYLSIANAASTYSVLGHSHTIVNVTGLQTALDAKLASTTAASTYSLLGHGHGVGDVIGLQDVLDSLGTVKEIDLSGGATGFSFSGGPITTTGTFTLEISDPETIRTNLELGALALLGSLSFADLSSHPTTLSGYGITDAQPYDSDLWAIASLTTSSYGRSILTTFSAGNAQSYLGLVIGTDVQAYDADLADLADGSLTGSKVGTGISASYLTTGTLDVARIGTGDIGPTQLASTAVTPGSYTLANVTVDADGRITAIANGTGGGGGDALTSGHLGQFAATTSAQLRAVLSDESGTGIFLTANGNGGSLTSLDASSISTGTLNVARIGTGDIGPTQLASTAVTPGTYGPANLTVDADGRLTFASAYPVGGAEGLVTMTPDPLNGARHGSDFPYNDEYPDPPTVDHTHAWLVSTPGIDQRRLFLPAAEGTLALVSQVSDVADALESLVGTVEDVSDLASDAIPQSWLVDDDTFGSPSATTVPSSESVKAYVLANAGGGGGGSSPTTTLGDMIVRGASADERVPVGGPLDVLAPGSSGKPHWIRPEAVAQWHQEFVITQISANEDEEITYSGSGSGFGWSPLLKDDYTSMDHLGIVVGSTGTTSGGYATLIAGAPWPWVGAANLTFGRPLESTIILAIPTLSDGTDTFAVCAGIFSLEGFPGAYFRYEHSTNSGKWQCITQQSSATTSDSGVTAVAGDWYNLRVTDDGTSTYFFINHSLVATHTTNRPTAGISTGGVGVFKSNGTTARLLRVDYMGFRALLTR